MNLKRTAISMLALALGVAGPAAAAAFAAQDGPPPPRYAQGRDRRDLNRPPSWFNEMQRRGFADGVDGAQKDYGNRRQPNVTNRWEYDHPRDVPRSMWDAYRDGFRRGYYRTMARLSGGPGRYDDDDDNLAWNMAPREFGGIERQGFMDGIDGAQKDYGNNRRPNVNNRWEYLHPRVPQREWDPYRYGFRMGYEQATAHLSGGYPGGGVVEGPWNAPPREYNQIQRRGYLDGIDGAQKDYGNRRRPDVNNRWEYNHPRDVPRSMWNAYRDAFRRGYDRAMQHLMGGRYR